MSRLRAAAAGVGDLLARLWAPFRPEPGTTEGAVMLGLVLLFVGFMVAAQPALAFIVPGGLLVTLGALPAIRSRG